MIFFLDRFNLHAFGLAVAVREFSAVLDSPGLVAWKIDSALVARSNLRSLSAWTVLINRDRSWHMNDMFAPLCIVMTCMGLLTGRQVILCPHGMLDRWALRSGRYRLKRFVIGLINLLARWGHLSIHALTSSEQRKTRILFSNARRSEIIPNGVPADILSLALLSDADASTKGGSIMIGTFSRVSPKKNQIALVELAYRMRATRPDLFEACKFRIDGFVEDSDYMEQVRDAIAQHGLEASFECGGPIRFEERGALLQGYDILFFPSKSEGMPYTVLESMALGILPVVSQTAACGFAAPYGAIIFCDVAEAVFALPGNRTELRARAINRSAFLSDYGTARLSAFLKSFP